MILVGSKTDLEQDRKVSQKQGEQLAASFEIDWIETSAKDDSNIEKVFEKLTEKVMEKVDIEAPIKETIPIQKHKQN